MHNIPYFVSKMDLNSKIVLNSGCCWVCFVYNRYSQLIDIHCIGISIYMY